MKKIDTKTKRLLRNRSKLKKVNFDRYRITIFKSLKNISAQIIDDKQNTTIVSASSMEKELKQSKKNKTDKSILLGEVLAKRATEKKINKVYFDRGGYKYHGRVKALAESLMKEKSEYLEKLVAINRITKVVKGGRRFGFAALVVAGNQKGLIGIGQGKSKQVPDAIKKATEVAKRNMVKIPLKDGRTLHHDVFAKSGSGKILMRAAPTGTGIIAGGATRAVCEVLGIQDIVTKSLGSPNPHNVLKAVLRGLKNQNSPKIISAMRNKKIAEVIKKREN